MRLLPQTRDSEDDPHPARRAMMEWLWEESAAYVDPDALARAKLDMPPVFWELYLAYALKRLGVALVKQSRSPKRQGGPDLRTHIPDVWIEAVMPTSGDGEDALRESVMGVACSVPNSEFVLRLTSAFETKARVFRKYISEGVVPKSHNTVIAISGGRLHTKYLEQVVPRIARSLFGVGNQVLTIDLDKGQTLAPTLQVVKGSEM